MSITAAVSEATSARPSLVRATVPVGLEYTADCLAGAYAAVRSWAHLEALAARVATDGWRWLIVQRRNDPGQRFVQCIRENDERAVEVGALDAGSGRHSVWRLHGTATEHRFSAPSHVMSIARDWLSLGVVPGHSAVIVPLGSDDEPF